MFTGIIQSVGTVAGLEEKGGDTRVNLSVGKLDMSDVQLGDSIAVNGVCLTVIEFDDSSFSADVSKETLSRTSFAGISTGSTVNLEKALTLQDRLGGHLVSGHVDGVGEVVDRRPSARSEVFRVRAPKELCKYIAEKGSICVDGVSLTVNDVEEDIFFLNIVPHTIQETTIGNWKSGTLVNLEVDVIARYLERLMLGGTDSELAGRITPEFLAEHGFLK